LVEKGRLFRVAVLVFAHAEDIDFTAPIEVLGQAGAQVFTVAATTDPVDTVFGLHLRPDYDLAHAPAADLLLIPGGGVDSALKDEQIMAWIRQRASQSRYVMSVCNGAFILAKAGLLDGLKATTTAGHIDELRAAAPRTEVLRERLTDNGRVITTGGLSAGIDGALHVIEREYGRTRAEEIARGIEYQWQPDLHWTRSALADLRLPDIRLPADASWETVVSHGDTRQWETVGRLEIAMSADSFLDYATEQITASGWILREKLHGSRTFARTEEGGQSWVTTLTSMPDGNTTALKETMTIRLAGLHP
jgi:putative intracellular protease/amidase